MLVGVRRIRVVREETYQAPRSSAGWHKPPPVLTPSPTVAPSALSAGIEAFANSCGQACGGVGQLLGATAALLNSLADPSA